jgi:hypothetical protein
VPHHTSAGFRPHPTQQQQQQQQQQQLSDLAITPSDATANHSSAAATAEHSAYNDDSYDVLAQSPPPCSALAGSLQTVEVPVGVSAKHGKLCKGRSLHTLNSSSSSSNSGSSGSGDCVAAGGTAAVATTTGSGTSDSVHRNSSNNSNTAAAAQQLDKQSLALCASRAPCRWRRATAATAGGYTAATAADASARDCAAQAAKIAAKRSQRKVLQLPPALCAAAAAATPAQARAAQLAAAAKHSSGVVLARGWRSAPGAQLQLDCGVGAGTRDVRMFAGRAVCIARDCSAESARIPSSA